MNFNRAADALNYAQSTVSAQIKLLEEELGVSLFDRLGKRIVITEAGQKLMRYAQKKLKVIPWLDEPLETCVLMIRHKDKWISPALQAFMDISREMMKLSI